LLDHAGLGKLPINRIAELTPTARLTPKLTAKNWRKSGHAINRGVAQTNTEERLI
jgi:hypothetical protein